MREVHRFEHRNHACPACCFREVQQMLLPVLIVFWAQLLKPKLCCGWKFRTESLGVSKPVFFTCPVGSIINGDTVEVLHVDKAERIRLNGIDCPEKGQAYGTRAKHATSVLAFGKEVTAQTYGLDKYKRTIGEVILPDGVNLNRELVKQGWWWYRKYAPADTVLEGLETEAREARKGLCAEPHPMPPWEWRRRFRGRPSNSYCLTLPKPIFRS